MPDDCILWHNREMISRTTARPLALLHGDYTRIAVPPGSEEVHHIATRCVASTCPQGISTSELCDRHALYTLGWYDTIIGPPSVLVPLLPDADDFAMLQTCVAIPALNEKPWFLQPKPVRKVAQNEVLHAVSTSLGRARAIKIGSLALNYGLILTCRLGMTAKTDRFTFVVEIFKLFTRTRDV